jgi:hypothetical protein
MKDISEETLTIALKKENNERFHQNGQMKWTFHVIRVLRQKASC